ncbi:hypothetical protein J1C67_14930 [Clostridium gasigenes]|nr:hypothetical protein [Clostridium gasigenes]QSW18827.1 hypothetical protein J1C67_14930 [Clostridium gasigenes]
MNSTLNLHSHMTRWPVYIPGVAPISGNQCGYLSPSQFNGLIYLGYNVDPLWVDVYRIETGSFGEVSIWCPKDSDSCTKSITCVGNLVYTRCIDGNEYTSNPNK